MGLTAVASSLTGPAVTGFRTFAGSGAASRTNISRGILAILIIPSVLLKM